jgi:hypothetical protein
MAHDSPVPEVKEPGAITLTKRQLAIIRLTRGAAGALLGAAALIALQAMAGSSEPPIRVRNGSIELELIGNRSWKQTGNDGTSWKMSWRLNGGRSHDYYEAAVVVSADANCAAKSFAAKIIRIEYTDQTWVDIDATKKKTNVKASKPLEHPTPQLLTYETPPTAPPGEQKQRISAIRADGKEMCSFATGELTTLFLLDADHQTP